MASMKFILLGLLLLGLINSGLSRPEPANDNDDNYQNDAEDEYQDDDNDYAQDYDDDTSKDQSNQNKNKEEKDSAPAYFENDKMSKAANSSQNVVLACPIKNLNPKNHVIMWYNYTSLLFQKLAKISTDSRLTLDDNFSLHIKDVQVTDSNMYLCKVFPEKITYTVNLKVHGPLTRASIFANNVDVTSKKLTYDVRHPSPEFNGEVLRLECRASGGNPAGRVTWSHKGKKFEQGTASHHIHVYNNTLEVRHITRKHAGDYQCLADNGFGKPVHASAELVVAHKPAFLKEENAVNTAFGETAQLHCKFEANPEPQHVHWYKVEGAQGNERIHDTEKHTIKNHFSKDGGVSTTTLVIHNINQQDLHEYTCQVENAIGKAKSKIFLNNTPASPQLVSHSYKAGTLTAKWEIHSHQPLDEVNVMTRAKGHEWVSHVTAVTTEHKPRNNVWTVKTHINLENGDYDIKARAKNIEGWSAIYSDEHKLNLEKDTDEIAVAKIGGGTGGSQSISRVSVYALALLVSAVLFIRN
ncbi:neurotrimin-like isoform X2 [Culicoides brevitarsis]|uniref:neurotrimin-like isoform X2 n=1 Tax=Culicoides brevitarsis TaxID=469753 RepID=UPI00307BBF61